MPGDYHEVGAEQQTTAALIDLKVQSQAAQRTRRGERMQA
jgi:hypothetical protein